MDGERAEFAPHRRSRFVCMLLMVSLVSIAGCAGRESVLAGGSSTGQLKTTLSHLQFENEQLKTKVAQLEEEHRTVEDRLVQEQIHNGDLAARLDDARNLLRDRGLEAVFLVSVAFGLFVPAFCAPGLFTLVMLFPSFSLIFRALCPAMDGALVVNLQAAYPDRRQ